MEPIQTENGETVHLFNDEEISREIASALLKTFFKNGHLQQLWESIDPKVQKALVLEWKSIIKTRLMQT